MTTFYCQGLRDDNQLDVYVRGAMASFAAYEERLLARMLTAWDFDAWGSPAVLRKQPVLAPAAAPETDYRSRTVTLPVDIIGLVRDDVPLGEVGKVLVYASDHLDEGAPADDVVDIMAKLRACSALVNFSKGPLP